jgi:hypothetical protein
VLNSKGRFLYEMTFLVVYNLNDCGGGRRSVRGVILEYVVLRPLISVGMHVYLS